MKRKTANKKRPFRYVNFSQWWEAEGKCYDPATSDVPWFDKRKALAEAAFKVSRQRPISEVIAKVRQA